MSAERDLYLPCSFSLENPENSQDSPIKAIQVDETALWPRESDETCIKLKPKIRSRSPNNNSYLIRNSSHPDEEQVSILDRNRMGFERPQKLIAFQNKYSLEEQDLKCLNQCFNIAQEGQKLQSLISKIKLEIEEQCKVGNQLVQAMSLNISGISHWQKGYFDCTKLNVGLDQTIQHLTLQIKKQQEKISKGKEEKKNNEDLLKILQNIDTIKSAEYFPNSPLRIQSKEKQNSLENSMRLSMISSSGKKYTKVAPIAKWDQLLPDRSNTEKVYKKKIFMNKDCSTSKRTYNILDKEKTKGMGATVIDIPKLFKKTSKIEEGEKKLKKMRTIEHYGRKKNNENNINIGNIRQTIEKPSSVTGVMAGKNTQKVFVRLSLCKKAMA